jgi:leader peptidase (prepilin peptidase)/N-methyltransferase
MGLIWAFGTQLDFYPHLLGAALGYGAFWAVEVAYRLIRKRDGLGRGDAKLLAVGGAWCGAIALPFIVLIASVSALIHVWPERENRELRLAFGPYLALGIALIWLGQRAL